MSLAIKRGCPFTLPIHRYNDPRALLTMDSYAPRCINRSGYPEWEPLSPIAIPEEIYKDTLQRAPSPPKRARNAKNLSLNVPSGPINNIASTSAPASPFRSPRLPNKRAPNLTINVHSLHRHPSTPELYASNIGTPIVASPGPYTSKQFPSLNIDTRHTDAERPKVRHTDPTVISTVPYEESIEREKAYPDGPRLIIEPNIWLYAEPDLALAKTYDVVVNVAREVNNPFIVAEVSQSSYLSPRSDSVASTPSPFSPSSSIISNPSPSLPSSNSSGTSPRLPLSADESGPAMSYKYNEVEYIHIPWDHNSSLSQELPGIVDHILERSEQGKKILVHCQCGVSRSATLVIALVMKKFKMGTHEAYAYVKERSPWIGPNMSLIYQLTDYGRLCGYERKASIPAAKPVQESNPSTAPLVNTESRQYKETFPKSLHSQLSRAAMAQTQSQDRHKVLDADIDRVAQSLSSPRFVLSEETRADF